MVWESEYETWARQLAHEIADGFTTEGEEMVPETRSSSGRVPFAPWTGKDMFSQMQDVDGWGDLQQFYESLSVGKSRIKPLQWRLFAWLHCAAFKHMRFCEELGIQTGAWPTYLRRALLVIIYADEWVDESPEAAVRAERLAWIEREFCHGGKDFHVAVWPPGLEVDGPLLLDAWKADASSMDAATWERFCAHGRAMLRCEQVLIAVDRVADVELLRHRIGSVQHLSAMGALLYGVEENVEFFTAAAAWIVLTDDIEDRHLDAERGQWNWFVAHPPRSRTAWRHINGFLSELLRRLCATAPVPLYYVGGAIEAFLTSLKLNQCPELVD